MNKKYILLLILVLLLTACSIDNRLDSIENQIDRGNYKEAEKKLLKLKERKDEKRIYDLLLTLYEKEGRDQEKLLLEGIDKFDSLDYRKELAELYLDRGLLDRSLLYYEEIIELDKDRENFRKLFSIYKSLKKDRSFIASYEKNKKYIDDIDLKLEAALAYIRLNRESDARDLLASLDESNLTSLREMELLAEYYFRINDNANSYRIVREGLSKYSQSTILYGYQYGFVNSDGYRMIDIYEEDVNGDGERENIILLSDSEELLNSSNIILTVQASSDGEILGKKRLDSYRDYYKLEFLDFDGDGIRDIYLALRNSDMAEEKPKVYSFIENNFKDLTEDYAYSDLSIETRDNNKLVLDFDSQDKRYILDMDDNYDEEDLNWANHSYRPKALGQGDYGIEESYELVLKDRQLAVFKVVYNYKDEKMDIRDIDLDTDIKYRIEKNNGEDFKLIDQLTLDNFKDMLELDRRSIYRDYGQPSKIDFYKKERLTYNGVEFLLEKGQVDSLRILKGEDILGLKLPASYQEIKSKLKEADREILGQEYLDEYEIIYIRDGLRFSFIGNRQEEDSFILNIEKENR